MGRERLQHFILSFALLLFIIKCSIRIRDTAWYPAGVSVSKHRKRKPMAWCGDKQQAIVLISRDALCPSG